MTSSALPEASLKPALLIVRITLGVFLLQWGIEKMFYPQYSMAINRVFYFGIIPNTATVWLVIGILQSLIALAIIAGFQQKWSYLAGFIIHGLSTLSSWSRLIDPYDAWSIIDPARSMDPFNYPRNHLFMTAIPVLAAFWLIWRNRHLDTMASLDHRGS